MLGIFLHFFASFANVFCNSFCLFTFCGNSITNSNFFSKETFHIRLSAKLSNQCTSAKTDRSVLKIFVNGENVPRFLGKVSIFNNFYSQQCDTLSNINTYISQRKSISTTSTMSKPYN